MSRLREAADELQAAHASLGRAAAALRELAGRRRSDDRDDDRNAALAAFLQWSGDAAGWVELPPGREYAGLNIEGPGPSDPDGPTTARARELVTWLAAELDPPDGVAEWLDR